MAYEQGLTKPMTDAASRKDGGYIPPNLIDRHIRKERKNGTWNGYPVIGRGTKIDGGVILQNSETGILVDSDSQVELLNIYKTFIEANAHILKRGGLDRNVLYSAVRSVLSVMPYSESEDKFRSLVAELRQNRIGPVTLAITSFINRGEGVCSVQSGLLGFILEKLRNDGFLKGKVIFEGSKEVNDSGSNYAHEYIRYITEDGEELIADAAMEYVGSPEGNKEWQYGYSNHSKLKSTPLAPWLKSKKR